MGRIDRGREWVHVVAMSNAIEKTAAEAVADVQRELDALAPGATLTDEAFLSLLRRLPKVESVGPSSAEIIRELRGPLPEDDPEYQRNHRR